MARIIFDRSNENRQIRYEIQKMNRDSELKLDIIFFHLSGDDGREVTPVPIPNTEVKLSSADGSWSYDPREQDVAGQYIDGCDEPHTGDLLGLFFYVLI